MKISGRYVKSGMTTLGVLFLLGGCFSGDPPTEKDIAPIYTKNLAMVNAFSGWRPTEVSISNVKCSRSGSTYACSFDASGKLKKRSAWDGKVSVEDFHNTKETGKFVKAGDVWTVSR
jgi:hypothetical protein